jgi:hypothetical protein
MRFLCPFFDITILGLIFAPKAPFRHRSMIFRKSTYGQGRWQQLMQRVTLFARLRPPP